MHARSANLPFINVFFINEGLLNPFHPSLQHFTMTTGRNSESVTTYSRDSASGKIFMKTVEDESIVREDSLFFNDTIYDAPGLFMMMRCLASSGFNLTLNNIVEFKISQTHFSFTGEQEMLQVSAFDDPQPALKFHGKADWVGHAWAGVSGPFQGWISQDTCAFPLKVKIKIFLGSVTLELENFKRDTCNTSSDHSKFVKNIIGSHRQSQ
jgi:hypothetical protein